MMKALSGILFRVIMVLLFQIFCLFPGIANPPVVKVPKGISLDEAIGIALLNNHDYKIALQKMKAADERVKGVWGQLMPALESEASLARQSAENGFMSLSDGQYDIKVVQLRFGINPGIFYNSLKLSRKAYISTREEVRRIRASISYDVIKAYFSLLLSEEMIKLRKDSLSLLRENLKDVENLYRTGSVPRFELLQAQVRLKSQEPLLLEAENNYRVALDLFNFHLGSVDAEYTVDSSILKKERFRIPEGDRDEIIQRFSASALRDRPELIQLEMKREMAEHSKNVSSSYYLWPTFSIGGYYGKTKFLANQAEVTVDTPLGPMEPDMSAITGTREWQTTWQIRVAATYRWGTLFPTDSIRALEREERLRIRQAEEELLKLKRIIAISIKSSYSGLVTSFHTIISRRDNVETAREGLRIAKESYRAGVIKNSELLSAQFSLTEARTGYINAVNQYYLSLAELKRETGIEDEKLIFKGN
jgi:outer membrane protein